MQWVGGEFMPALEEGNLWVRATMPVDIAFDQAARLSGEIREIFRRSPEVSTIVSQLGRPDDGTDPTSFFNAEFLANLKPPRDWRPGLTKDKLIEEIEELLIVGLEPASHIDDKDHAAQARSLAKERFDERAPA